MKAAPFVSIVMPVLNETGVIRQSLDRLRDARAGGLAELIVVDGDLRGSTVGAIGEGDVVKALSEKGRARQMNYGAKQASGEVLLFLHADTFLPQNAVELVRAVMNDDRVVAGAFDLGIDSSRVIYRITEKYVALRTRLTRAPFGDQAIFIRRKYFEELGGYREIPVMEDVELMRRIRKRGDRIRIIPEMARTSPRRYENEGVLSCTARNMTLQLLYACGISPERLARWYRS
jgi:rSAM/selenodomain-associated transferase 2